MESKKENKKPIIVLDDREKDDEFAQYLLQFGAKVEIQHLPVGDVFIQGEELSLLMEHKSVSDFGNSISDDRIFKQIKELIDASTLEGQEYFPAYLLIGDLWQLWKKRGFTMFQISGIINAIQLPPPFGFGLPVIRPHNNMFAAVMLCGMARKLQGDREVKPRAIRGGLKDPSPTMQALYILEGFPGIRAVRARDILNQYKILGKALDAMKNKEITEIPGIGEKISERVAAVFDYGIDEDDETKL
jgi:ERCC4-type nuclease